MGEAKDKVREVFLSPFRGCPTSAVRLLLVAFGLLGRAKVRTPSECVT